MEINKEIICTVCFWGCRLQVEGEGDKILTVEGNGCKRGPEYGSTEFAHPVRVLTTTIKLVDVAPTLAAVLDQTFADADGKGLTELMK